MSKIVFINAYETSYLGTRILASYMRAKGHQTHNIILCSGEYVAIDAPLEKHEGYQSYFHANLMVNKATRYKVGEADLLHLENVLKAEAPDVIGFSARSTNNWLIPVVMPVFRRAAPQALLVGGGFGPTLEPELYLDGGFDCVIRGDGEEPLAELMECVQENDLKRAKSIRNTVWKDPRARARGRERERAPHHQSHAPAGEKYLQIWHAPPWQCVFQLYQRRYPSALL